MTTMHNLYEAKKGEYMNPVENYKEIYKSIFNEDLKVRNHGFSNNCIGALNNSQYSIFNKNFIERIIRLKNCYGNDKHSLNELKNTIKDIANKKSYKWSGPYSELVALDYWLRFEDILDIKYINKSSVDVFPNSMAKVIGQKVVDIDISFTLHFTKIYMDVKSFIPTHIELTDCIMKAIDTRLQVGKFLIGIENLDGGKYIENKKDFIEELKSKVLIHKLEDAIKQKAQYYQHISSSGNKYAFRIAYSKPDEPLLLITEDSFEPYRTAYNNKYKILDYYNKLLIDEPSLLIFVVNPWFNKELMSGSREMNSIFYRSFCRRVFIELIKDETPLIDIIDDEATKSFRVKDVAQKISGLIFIEDYSVTHTDNDIYKTFIYLNPNCTNKRLKRDNFDILNWSSNAITPEVIDDFEYDNY
jgi:hypothetical protein